MTRLDDPLFDHRIADWLEGDPNRAPDQAAQTVLAAFPSIHQRRAWRTPWRFIPMTTSLKFAAGIAAILAVALGGVLLVGRPASDPGVGGPSSSPSPTVTIPPSASPTGASLTDTATWTSYTSPRYGYEAAYPAGWSYGPSSTFWVVPEPAGSLARMNDLVYGGYAGVDDSWAATSLVVPEGMTNDDWIALYRAGQIANRVPVEPLACYPAPDQWTAIAIDGRSAKLRLGCGVLEAILFVDGRVYAFAGWTDTTSTPGVPDDFRARFDAWLSTITLDPASALEPPVAGPSPS